MTHITLEPATPLSMPDLATLLNRAFSGYIIPIQFSADTLAAMVERDDILLAESFIASRDGAPLGVALVAVRPWRGGTRTRLAAMGVAPEGRRLGQGRTLLRRVITGAEERGSRQVLLEVFAANEPARRLYEVHGFTARRRLLGFTLDAAALRERDGPQVHLRPSDGTVVLPLCAACTAGQAPEAAPPWQADGVTLARYRPPVALYTVETPASAAPVGYLALGPGRPAAGLLQLGIVPAWRLRGLATAALSAAVALHPEITSIVVPQLVPEASSLAPFLRSCGATAMPDEQIEMALDLP